MGNIFTERDSYSSLRSENHLLLPKANTMIYGIDNINTDTISCGPHCRMKLKILPNSLSSNGK